MLFQIPWYSWEMPSLPVFWGAEQSSAAQSLGRGEEDQPRRGWGWSRCEQVGLRRLGILAGSMGVNRGKRRGVGLAWQLTFQGSWTHPRTERQSLQDGHPMVLLGYQGPLRDREGAELECTFLHQLK